MKQLTAFLFFSLCWLGLSAIQVIFQVDMTGSLVDPSGVHLAGDFGADGYPVWDPAGIAMSDNLDGTWSVTLDLTQGSTYEYKYINGTAWGQDEGAIPAPCGTGGGNRSVTVGAANETLALHCFASCAPCLVAPIFRDITFQVDMTGLSVDGAGVHLVGGFGSAGLSEWDPAAIPMTDQGGGIWDVTLALIEGESYEFKYVNGNTFAQDEGFLPAPCGTGGGNRSVTVGAADETLALHCFASCDPCLGPPVFHDITFRVEMSLQVVSSGVYLAGSFNGFDPTATPLTEEAGNIWTVTLSLQEGESYQYKFLNGPSFDEVEIVPSSCGVADGFGGFNREHIVGTGNEILDVVCYGTCAPCTFVNYNVTFQVDMSDEVVDPNGVHIIGTFNAFDPTANPMTAIGGGLWEAIIPITAGQTIEYAFVNGNTLSGQELVDVGCSNASGYREYFVLALEITVGPDCFGLCGSCPSNQVQVTFEVDMNDIATDPAGVFIVGSFQDPPFTAGLDLMTDPDLDDIWTYTVNLDPGTIITYKYLNGPTFANEETVPVACGLSNGLGGFDRTWTVGIGAETIPLHCFSSCNPCGLAPVNVTLQVDMNGLTVDPAGVFVAGSFNGFSESATPLVDLGSGIWAVDVSLEQGAQEEYIFLNGSSFANKELVPSNCGVDDGFGGFNRSLSVGNADQVEPLVCFGSCTVCAPPQYLVTFQVDMSFETIDPLLGVNLVGGFGSAGLPEWDPAGIPMTDMGNGIWSVQILLNEGELYEYKYVNGESFAQDEGFIPGPCGNGSGNRTWEVGSSDETIPLHCFASCDLCPEDVNVTFRVDMSQELVDPLGVYLAGSFNGWDPNLAPLSDLGNGIWETTILLSPNANFEYKFVNGIDLITQAESVPNECQVNGNRSFNTGIDDFSLSTVCFNECVGCFIDVTFRVDMFNESVSALGVHLAGSFQGWDPAATPMSYAGWGVYSITLPLERFTEYEWKFINGNAFGDDEDVPLACEQNWNRYMTTGGESFVLDIVCFGSCTLCEGCTDPFSLEFNPLAEGDNGSCATPSVWGCTYEDASNYVPGPNIDDGSCLFEPAALPCPQDINNDGIVNTGDLTNLLTAFGTLCD